MDGGVSGVGEVTFGHISVTPHHTYLFFLCSWAYQLILGTVIRGKCGVVILSAAELPTALRRKALILNTQPLATWTKQHWLGPHIKHSSTKES